MAKAAPEEEREARLERREHTAFVGTAPYFDEDLQVPQSPEHRRTISEVGSVLELIAKEAGLIYLSDHPIWYLHPETDEQKSFYGDLVIARQVDARRITAEDLLMVIEVVTTRERKKEIKDTVFQRAVNEYNGVPEFGLIYPDHADKRSMSWFTIDEENGRYREITLSPGSVVEPRAIPGLEIRVRPVEDWVPGRKLELYYLGEPRRGLEEERERAQRLEAKLRALGVDPDS